MNNKILAFLMGTMTWCWYTGAAQTDDLLLQGGKILDQLKAAAKQLEAGRVQISSLIGDKAQKGLITTGIEKVQKAGEQITDVKKLAGGLNDQVNAIPSVAGIKSMAFELVQLDDTSKILDTVNNQIIPTATKLLTDVQAKLEELKKKLDNANINAKFNNALSKLAKATTKLSKTMAAYKKSLAEA